MESDVFFPFASPATGTPPAQGGTRIVCLCTVFIMSTEKDQLQLLLTLENAMTVLYDFVMKEKERCDELIKRVEVLEANEKDNSR